MIRRCLALAAAVCAVVLATAPARAYTPHVLRYSESLDISSLNAFLATSGNIDGLDELTAAEFTRFDANGKPIPELITEIPSPANHGVSADGRSITWHLRPGLKWSDGAPLDADDVAYTVAVAQDPANNLTVRDPWTRIAHVDVPDKQTVVFHLREPNALFVADYFSTTSNSAVLPKHVLGPGTAINDAPYNGLPVGAGPFRYAAYHRGSDVEMEANPYYWRGKPKLQKVIYEIVPDENTLFTQLQTGEVDLWDLVNGTLAQRVKTIPGKRWSTRTSNFMSAIFFNTQHPVVADPRVRVALSYATDRALVIDKIVLGNGVITQSFVPRTSVDFLDLPPTPFDLVKAGQLLDAAGWKRGPDGVRTRNGLPLSIDLAVPSGYQPSATLAAILHDDWGKIGVNVTIHVWSTPQFFAIYESGGIIQTGKFDAALYSQSLGPLFANLAGVYDCASIPPKGENGARYCNPKVDALNDRYVHSFDAAERKSLAAQMQRLMNADPPGVMLYERTFLAAFDQRLTGFHPNSFSYWGDPLQLDI